MSLTRDRNVYLEVEVEGLVCKFSGKPHFDESSPGYGIVRTIPVLEIVRKLEEGEDEVEKFRQLAYSILKEIGDMK